jgi:hypothetical protein
LTNVGQRTWQAEGDQAFHLSYHLATVAAGMRIGLQYEGQRTMLPHDVPPGQSVSVVAAVITPPESGDYLIEWDMVQEGVTWFSAKGASEASTSLFLGGDPGSEASSFAVTPFDDALPPQPIPGRLMLWKAALQIALTHPVLGVGPDNFRHVYGAYLGRVEWDTYIHANNLYLEALADTGVVGLLAFLLMSWMLARAAWRRFGQHLPDALWLWQLALIGALLAWYLHGFVDFFYEFTPANTLFWIVVGLSVSTWRADRAAVEVNAAQG